MEHRFNRILYTIIFLFLFSCQNTKKADRTAIKEVEKITFKKVLMIGNSFTFYWNLPQVLETMFDSSNINIKVDQKTIGGSKLKDHWNYNKDKSYNIEDYEFVVLNDHSTFPLNNIDTCSKYINLFTKMVFNGF